MKSPLIVLFSGFDPSGSAGLLVDVKVTHRYSLPYFAIPASLTIQSYEKFVGSVESPPEYVRKVLSLLSNLHSGDTVYFAKMGMIKGKKTAEVIARWIKRNKITAVTDVILKPTFSRNFLLEEIDSLLKLASVSKVVTVSFDEGKFLLTKVSGTSPGNPVDLAMNLLKVLKPEFVLLKTGDTRKAGEKVTDYLISRQNLHIINYRKIPKSVRGTGCILSTSIICELAINNDIVNAVKRAYRFAQKAVKEARQVTDSVWVWV